MSDLVNKSIAIAIPFIINVPSSIITRNEVKTWYMTIIKPSFTPPKYVFGPVWSMLYGTMGYSSYLIWKEGAFTSETKLPLLLYGSQLLFNSAWSLIFFGRHKIGWAAVDISLLYLNVWACFITFRPINKNASNLLIPYIAWLTLAGAINIRTWQLNKRNKSASE